MSKPALIKAIATRHRLPKAAARRIVATLLDTMTQALVSEGSFSVSGFGRLTVVDRAARSVRNPGNGALLHIAARRSVKFTPGAALRRTLNAPKRGR